MDFIRTWVEHKWTRESSSQAISNSTTAMLKVEKKQVNI